MTRNRPSGLTVEELREIAVQHLLADTQHWEFIVTEADARAALDRMSSADDRMGPEIARQKAWYDEPEPATKEAA